MYQHRKSMASMALNARRNQRMAYISRNLAYQRNASWRINNQAYNRKRRRLSGVAAAAWQQHHRSESEVNNKA